MTNIYANVGKPGNLPQSLLLYTKATRFCRLFPCLLNAKTLPHNRLREFTKVKKSAKLCKSLQIMQTLGVRFLLSPYIGKTAQMRKQEHHPNRRKSFIFTEKSLPDFSIRYITTGLYGNRVFCKFCKFLQICRKSKEVFYR